MSVFPGGGDGWSKLWVRGGWSGYRGPSSLNIGVGVKGFFLGPIFKSMWLPICLKDFSLNYVKMTIFWEFSHFALIAAPFLAQIRQKGPKWAKITILLTE